MSDIQNEINACVESFVADLAEMARQAAYDTLSDALAQAGATADPAGAGSHTPSGSHASRRGGKRSSEEIDKMAEFFYVYVTQKPGQRMEQISKALGYQTSELNLPVKKLLSSGKIRIEGQKRATQYYPVIGRGRGKSGDSGRRRRRNSKR